MSIYVLTKDDRKFLKEKFKLSDSNFSHLISGRRSKTGKHKAFFKTCQILHVKNTKTTKEYIKKLQYINELEKNIYGENN